MKKPKLLGMFVACVAIAATIAVISFKVANERKLTELAMANVEALTAYEDPRGVFEGDNVYFEFNGQHWEGKKDGSKGNWFPQYDDCKNDGNNGHEVYCTNGDGNCWNGTSCIID